MTITLPVKAVSEMNARVHWAIRHERMRKQRKLVRMLWPKRQRIALPAVVTFTRVGKRALDDDNLASALKAIRDEVARLLGCGDSPKDPIAWRYTQEKGAYSVRIEVQEAEVCDEPGCIHSYCWRSGP